MEEGWIVSNTPTAATSAAVTRGWKRADNYNQMQALTLQAWQSVQCWGESLWHMRSRNKRAEGGGAGEGADWGVSQWLRSLVVAALHLLVLPPFLLLTTTAAAMEKTIVVVARMARACTTSRRLAASAFSTVPSSKLANA